MMQNNIRLFSLHNELKQHYKAFREGIINEDQYLALVKPIDQEIDQIEMANLRDIPALKEASLLLSRK